MKRSVQRRQVLLGSGAALLVGALDGCAQSMRSVKSPAASDHALQLPPLRASMDRITAITVCTRPFRPQGPRLDLEQVGQKVVVHNYGHGGSGWSLSWGSSTLAADKALGTGERDVAVIGCGALGMTSALLLQRAGARVTIYAKEVPPNVRSSLATGVFTPDSRICFEPHATPAFKQLWAQMARTSHQTYQTLLGLPGDPVEFVDNYLVSDEERPPSHTRPPQDSRPLFAELQREMIPDLLPQDERFAPGSHPFGAARDLMR